MCVEMVLPLVAQGVTRCLASLDNCVREILTVLVLIPQAKEILEKVDHVDEYVFVRDGKRLRDLCQPLKCRRCAT